MADGTGVGVRDGSGVALAVGLAKVGVAFDSEMDVAVFLGAAVAVAGGTADAVADGTRVGECVLEAVEVAAKDGFRVVVCVLVRLGVVAVLNEVGAGEGVRYSPNGGGLSHACTRALDTNSVQITWRTGRSLILLAIIEKESTLVQTTKTIVSEACLGAAIASV